MKSLAKLLLLAAVAVTAVAVSVAPSEAAKKKKITKPVACAPVGAWCTMGGSNVLHFCAGDGKWTAALLPACVGPGCPPSCK